MARDHARIQVSIWSDPDFRDLTVPAQHLYLTILSQPRLSYAGVIDYLPTRLAQLSGKATVRTVANTTATLVEARFFLVDEATGELLVRTFVRHDGLLTSPNMTKAMVKDYLSILSPALRVAVEDELSRAHADNPSLGGWKGLQEASPALHSIITAKGSRKGSANG